MRSYESLEASDNFLFHAPLMGCGQVICLMSQTSFSLSGQLVTLPTGSIVALNCPSNGQDSVPYTPHNKLPQSSQQPYILTFILYDKKTQAACNTADKGETLICIL
jgi:hypothetical protein